MRRAVLAFTSMVVFHGFAGAQERPAESETGRVTIRADAQSIVAGAFVSPADNRVNPRNTTLRIPQTTWLAELRVNTRVEAGSRWQLILRPRVRGAIDAVRMGGSPAEYDRDAIVELTEGYFDWRIADAVSIAYGLQNFQWGPAEMMAPSNRVFHELGVFRDPLYSVRGKHLARVNVSAGRQWSLVALAELGGTDEAPFRAGATFRRGGQAKLEFATGSGDTYAGVTGGVRKGEPPWTGGYAAFTLPAGFSAYIDGSVQRGSQAWYPVRAVDGSIDFATDARSGGARSLALAGLRYTYSAAFDARFEWLRQDAGYTREQIAAAPVGVAEHPSPETIERWTSPGLEFVGRSLALVSVLARDIGPAERLDLQGRYIRSFTDRSGAVFVTANLDVTGAAVLFASLTLTHGEELAEFTRLARAGVVTGLTWSW
jgi:hypothetical protein